MRFLAALVLLSVAPACTTLPTPSHGKHVFPKEAHVGPVTREYEKIGVVRTKVNFPSLDPNYEETALCRNYYNKAAQDLVSRAKDRGAEAVIEVKSVVYLGNGKQETYPTPECSDDGEEGQILLQGIAVKWKKAKDESNIDNNK